MGRGVDRCKEDGCSKKVKARELCGRHYERWRKDSGPVHRTKEEVASDIASGSKVCRSCKERKPFSEFRKANRKSQDSRQARCKVCVTKENKEKIHGWNLRKYGITKEYYDSLLEAQDGCCSLCGSKGCPTGKRLSVDHDHATNKVRALLCVNCNQGLGSFRDDSELLQKAIRYLGEHNGCP